MSSTTHVNPDMINHTFGDFARVLSQDILVVKIAPRVIMDKSCMLFIPIPVEALMGDGKRYLVLYVDEFSHTRLQGEPGQIY